MSPVLPTDVLAALGLPPTTRVSPVGGATGTLAKVERDGHPPVAVRWTRSEAVLEWHLLAMEAAARAGLRVPEVLRHVRLAGGGAAAVLSWLPGVPVYDLLRADLGRAYALGRLMGEAQAVLHGVQAPGGLPAVADDPPHGWPSAAGVAGATQSGATLLHLDWHGFNLLVDGDEVSGVVDWDNARAGQPVLDLARTSTLFTVEPALAELGPAERAALAGAAEGWADGYGPQARAIPAACLAWAGEVMLADLAGRPVSAAGLAALRRWTAEQQRQVG